MAPAKQPGGPVHEVIVVGAGPVGLLLALDLVRSGVDAVVIDRRTAQRSESRATTLNWRSRQILQDRGVWSRLGEVTYLPAGHFAGLDLPPDAAGQWKCAQTDLEAALLDELADAGGTVQWETTLIDLENGALDATVSLSAPEGVQSLHAQFVIGCDGEDSVVRSGAGIDFDGRAGTRRLLRADVVDLEVRARRFELVEHGMVAAAPLPTGATRVMMHRHGDTADVPDSPAFGEVCEVWKDLTGEDLSGGRAVWVDAFADEARWVASCRQGRAVLAGDAAHLLMPAGGLPLNLGLDDAARLSWRLAAVVRRGVDDSILDDYSADAVARARAAALNVGAQAHLLLSESDVEPQRALMAQLLELDSVRQEVVGVLTGRGSVPRHQTGGVLGGLEVLTAVGQQVSIADSLAHGRPVLWCRETSEHQVWRSSAADDFEVIAGEPLGDEAALLASDQAVLVLPDGTVAWSDRDEHPVSSIFARTLRRRMSTYADLTKDHNAQVRGTTISRGRRLTGKRCLVTGASRGIGRGIALDLAREGATVAVHCAQQREKADEVVEEIQSFGGAAFVVVADFDSADAVQDLVSTTVASFGERELGSQVDVLVNNAGVMGGMPLERIEPEVFDRLMNINVRAPFFLTRSVLRAMPNDGRIVNISSGLTKVANPDEIAYAMTKGSIEQLTRHLAKAVASRGITVNAVAPGITDNGSPIFADPGAVEMMSGFSPFGRVGEPSDIAAAVSFLASDEARWITGSVIDASGGTVLG